MGYHLSNNGLNQLIESWSNDYIIYAPKRIVADGRFSDTDTIRYGQITSGDDIVFNEKAQYSFKEVLLPLSQTLFYYTENHVTEPEGPTKNAIVFLRSCDLHGVKRLDEIYLNNEFEDYYYKQLRDRIQIVVIGCSQSFENCFCVSMHTNIAQNFDACINQVEDGFDMDTRSDHWKQLLKNCGQATKTVVLDHVDTNDVQVSIPKNLSFSVAYSSMWKEYDSRCIACGRCNFVCPTCTCFTMQDIFYTDNGKCGERRRVSASCMVDGYTDVAGGGSYRKDSGDRMRFKVLHKVYDYNKRFGYHMCVGCGRCDDVCPEYISFSHCINRLDQAQLEVKDHE